MIKGNNLYFNFYIQERNQYIKSDNFQKILLLLNHITLLNNNTLYIGLYYEHKNVDTNRIKGFCPLLKIENQKCYFLDNFQNNKDFKDDLFIIQQTLYALKNSFQQEKMS